MAHSLGSNPWTPGSNPGGATKDMPEYTLFLDGKIGEITLPVPPEVGESIHVFPSFTLVVIAVEFIARTKKFNVHTTLFNSLLYDISTGAANN